MKKLLLFVTLIAFASVPYIVEAKGHHKHHYKAKRKHHKIKKENSHQATVTPQENNPYKEGDHVCVKKWRGTGFCGTVDRITGEHLKVEITSIDCGGMVGLCNADPCSGDRNVSDNSSFQEAAKKGDFIWTKPYCVTSN